MKNTSDQSTPVTPLTLVINSAEGRLQVAAGNAQTGALVFSFEYNMPRQGAELLTPAIADAMAAIHEPMSAITRIALVNGPGSFTGMRLALSTGLGLARALNVPMGAIPSTLALAFDANPVAGLCPALGSANAQCMSGNVPLYMIWVLLHARRDQLVMQGFAPVAPYVSAESLAPTNSHGSNTQSSAIPLRAVTDIETVSVRAACEKMHRTPACQCIVCGSGLRKNEAAIRDYFTAAQAEHCAFPILLPVRFDQPRPESLLFCAAQCEWSHEPVEPLYARPCDAEENLPVLAARRGISAQEACDALERMTHS